jgi:CBS domain-containing protein
MSIEIALRQEQVVHLDLSDFAQVEPDTTIRATVDKMRQENHHCALVIDRGQLVGIFTDRDILHRVVDEPGAWDRPITTAMTSNPFTVKSSDPADVALNLMNTRQFRNVPVLDDQGSVIGNLTHYAVIKYLADRFAESIYNLPPEPDRVTRRRDGA